MTTTRFKTTRVEFLSQIEVIHGLSRDHELRRTLMISEADEENDEIRDLFIDCDHIKLDGEIGRGDVMFVTFNINKTTYIILYDDTFCSFDGDEKTAKIKELILWWLEGAPGDLDVPNNWMTWDTVKEGVAYRGGAGYCYDLFAKTLQTKTVAA